MAEHNDARPVPDDFRRADNFVCTYANNIRFEPSIWDLRIYFSQVLEYGSPAIIEQRGVITVPWLQAKAMALFLALNVAAHEETDGPIRIPSTLLGPALKSIEDRHITLEQIFGEIIKTKANSTISSSEAK
jgi:hypothetical protein